ncbi:hypothetical protein [Christiangramia sp. OXR-203]|jgi:hypothetical protein|uniref:hypothetical protein n=1 Tax=Christiangramia sp. OXR-203 TaxID=3100176 RepID=UPI002AC9C303|nr:hypothetical protein [Christiangramia sp. OXR-203]WPY98326.1 hypothetical protein T8I65_14250 [Christiangramia sp. OXR-203]
MKKILFAVAISVLCSCNFETRKISSEEVLEQESRTLNWKEVDEYPAFEDCQNLTDLAEAKDCFARQVSTTIYSHLASQQPVVTKSIDDTLFIYLEIDKNGKPQVESIEVDTTVTNQLPDIKNWIRQSIDSLPEIYPASKRGIPVSTVFKMPVVVKAE